MPKKTVKNFLILELNNLKNFIWNKKFILIVYFSTGILLYIFFRALNFGTVISLLSSVMWSVSLLFLIDIIKERWNKYKGGNNARNSL